MSCENIQNKIFQVLSGVGLQTFCSWAMQGEKLMIVHREGLNPLKMPWTPQDGDLTIAQDDFDNLHFCFLGAFLDDYVHPDNMLVTIVIC